MGQAVKKHVLLAEYGGARKAVQKMQTTLDREEQSRLAAQMVKGRFQKHRGQTLKNSLVNGAWLPCC